MVRVLQSLFCEIDLLMQDATVMLLVVSASKLYLRPA